MNIYLVGISCVGKTTVGKMLAEKIGFSFFDLDEEIQEYYQKPIERIQDECLTMNGYRKNSGNDFGRNRNQSTNASCQAVIKHF